MQQLNRDGIKLVYQEAGSGAPPLLFVHGFGGDHTHFAPQMQYFSRSHRVVAVDRLGHGQSSKPEQDYTIIGFADDLAWTCAELGLYRPVVVVHSMGAIGLELAAGYPELLAALVIIDAPILPPAEVGASFRQLLEGLRSPAYREVIRQLADAIVFLPTDNQERKARLLEGMCAVPQHVLSSTWEQFLNHDTAAAAARCQVPLLYIGGVFPADLARFKELCPQLTTERIEGVGHFLQLEAADQVNTMLDHFLTRLMTPQAVVATGKRSS